MDNNNISRKTIFLGALSFWILGYTVSLIILFIKIKFETVSTTDTFLTLLLTPLSAAFLVYYPLYILPLFLAKYLKSILSIILSFFIAFPLYFILSLCAADSSICRKELGVFMILILIQIFFCLGIFIIFSIKKERIIPKLTILSLLLFFIVIGYIAFSAKTVSAIRPIQERLSQNAVEANDVSLCNKILEESKKRNVCAKDYQQCDSLSESYYTSCIEKISVALGDESNCGADAECKKKVFLKTTDLCQDFLNEEKKIKCIQQVAKETNNIELCKKILGGERCIGPIAAQTNNVNLCFEEEINYDGHLNPFTCFKEVFKYTDDANICNGLTNDHNTYKEGCLIEAVSKVGDIKLCENVGGNDYSLDECYDPDTKSYHACLPDMDKSACFRSFFSKTEDSQACEGMEEGVNRDVCYYAAADVLNNRSLCESIKEETWKKWCHEDFGP